MTFNKNNKQKIGVHSAHYSQSSKPFPHNGSIAESSHMSSSSSSFHTSVNRLSSYKMSQQISHTSVLNLNKEEDKASNYSETSIVKVTSFNK